MDLEGAGIPTSRGDSEAFAGNGAGVGIGGAQMLLEDVDGPHTMGLFDDIDENAFWTAPNAKECKEYGAFKMGGAGSGDDADSMDYSDFHHIGADESIEFAKIFRNKARSHGVMESQIEVSFHGQSFKELLRHKQARLLEKQALLSKPMVPSEFDTRVDVVVKNTFKDLPVEMMDGGGELADSAIQKNNSSQSAEGRQGGGNALAETMEEASANEFTTKIDNEPGKSVFDNGEIRNEQSRNNQNPIGGGLGGPLDSIANERSQGHGGLDGEAPALVEEAQKDFAKEPPFHPQADEGEAQGHASEAAKKGDGNWRTRKDDERPDLMGRIPDNNIHHANEDFLRGVKGAYAWVVTKRRPITTDMAKLLAASIARLVDAVDAADTNARMFGKIVLVKAAGAMKRLAKLHEVFPLDGELASTKEILDGILAIFNGGGQTSGPWDESSHQANAVNPMEGGDAALGSGRVSDYEDGENTRDVITGWTGPVSWMPEPIVNQTGDAWYERGHEVDGALVADGNLEPDSMEYREAYLEKILGGKLFRPLEPRKEYDEYSDGEVSLVDASNRLKEESDPQADITQEALEKNTLKDFADGKTDANSLLEPLESQATSLESQDAMTLRSLADNQGEMEDQGELAGNGALAEEPDFQYREAEIGQADTPMDEAKGSHGIPGQLPNGFFDLFDWRGEKGMALPRDSTIRSLFAMEALEKLPSEVVIRKPLGARFSALASGRGRFGTHFRGLDVREERPQHPQINGI